MATTFAEHDTTAFNVRPGTVQFLATILEAASRKARVTIKVRDNDNLIRGVARAVVHPNDENFASVWTERSRLWVTGAGELWLALGDIEAIITEEA